MSFTTVNCQSCIDASLIYTQNILVMVRVLTQYAPVITETQIAVNCYYAAILISCTTGLTNKSCHLSHMGA